MSDESHAVEASGSSPCSGARYMIIQDTDALVLSGVVTDFLQKGWYLHGDLKLHVIADDSKLTFASLLYVQAMKKENP